MVLVIAKDETPLMPTSNKGLVRKYLKSGKAKIVSYNPFTIQLLRDSSKNTQEVVMGIDVGRVNIGFTIVTEKEVVVTGELVTRNKDIPNLMKKRASFRRSHRKHRREKIQRKAVSNATSFIEREKYLPSYSKPITCKYINNKEARYSNRKRVKGWLTPTANHLLITHENLIEKYKKYIPISKIVLEINKFSFMAMENPNIKKWEYSKGPLQGKGGLHNAIIEMQDNHCLMCENAVQHFHHVVPQSKGGSDTLTNIVGLCSVCHSKVHTDSSFSNKLEKHRKGIHKKYGSLSVLNQILPQLLENLSKKYEVIVTTGKETYQYRKEKGIEKTHANDSYVIALVGVSTPTNGLLCGNNINPILIKQYRRHDRQINHKENINRVYYYGKDKICYNRNKAYEQKMNSLKEIENRLIPYLSVKEHLPIRKNPARILPGGLVKVGNKYSIIKGTNSSYKGSPVYYKLENGLKVKIKDSKLLLRNKGLVVCQ